ncbi:MAG: SoxR reducing system RseC family protein [Cyclobacteriaceae bacterium]|nr:SoxR reducing system RseC family protein [Cyclobacteriaceae bacterium]
MKETIEHQGIVSRTEKGRVLVNLLNVAGCAGCHAKASCGVSDIDHKVIEVVADERDFMIGDTVKIRFAPSLGFLALVLGYVMPFFVLITTLFITAHLTGDELLAGLVSLAILVPYYLILSFFREKLKTTFSFSIYKENTSKQ